MTNTYVSIMAAVVLAVIVLALTIVAEVDRQPHPVRFGVSLRRSHLHGETGASWRWRVVPLFTSTPISDLITIDRTTKAAGRARTYLGAWYAGCRARRRIEDALIADRERFVALLHDAHDGGAGLEFPAEIPEELS